MNRSSQFRSPVLRPILASVLVLLLLFPAELPADPCENEECAVGLAGGLLAEGLAEEALTYLKEQAAAFPGSGRLHTLLAVAYSALGNHAWAIRTLTGWLEEHPEDCEARTWLAWSYLQLGEVREPLEHLPDSACSKEGSLETRAHLLRALLLHSAGRDGAEEELGKARGSREAFTADRAALGTLSRIIEPYRLSDLSWGVEVHAGFTTNALLGAPNDPTDRPGDRSSAYLQSNAWVRLNPDLGRIIRPSLELQARALHFFDPGADGLSYMNLTGRGGFNLDWGTVRLLAAYRPDYLLLGQGDGFESGPVWYAGGHRGEMELEIVPWLFAFAGGGHRTFRELGRTRYELDGGLAGQVLAVQRLRIVAALSGRRYWANEDGYDVTGLTALLNIGLSLPERWTLQAVTSLFADWYTGSDGFGVFGLEDGEKRRDLFLKVGVTAWSRVYDGISVGVGYEYSRRFSSASLFRLHDHRVLLKFRWSGSRDFRLPSLSTAASLADIPWGLSGGVDDQEDRIQDLLRQDEQSQNVCGCAQ